MGELINGALGISIILIIYFLSKKFSVQPKPTNIKRLKTVYKIFFAVMVLALTLVVLRVDFLFTPALLSIGLLDTALIVVILPLIYSIYGGTWFIASLVFLGPMIWVVIPIKLWFFTKGGNEKMIHDSGSGVA